MRVARRPAADGNTDTRSCSSYKTTFRRNIHSEDSTIGLSASKLNYTFSSPDVRGSAQVASKLLIGHKTLLERTDVSRQAVLTATGAGRRRELPAATTPGCGEAARSTSSRLQPAARRTGRRPPAPRTYREQNEHKENKQNTHANTKVRGHDTPEHGRGSGAGGRPARLDSARGRDVTANIRQRAARAGQSAGVAAGALGSGLGRAGGPGRGVGVWRLAAHKQNNTQSITFTHHLNQK
ncbi:hypothetical protein EVAR_46848_1 [Eumeta japonica]|uniref:Uncharacterized protein n=1 Tax=Eumeta variegata TaxID=151549 RepID=A0A4C1XR36_EUMVA|nr:hypothetical protein EVAR_46848_1 [Eumeta japonica]